MTPQEEGVAPDTGAELGSGTRLRRMYVRLCFPTGFNSAGVVFCCSFCVFYG